MLANAILNKLCAAYQDQVNKENHARQRMRPQPQFFWVLQCEPERAQCENKVGHRIQHKFHNVMEQAPGQKVPAEDVLCQKHKRKPTQGDIVWALDCHQCDERQSNETRSPTSDVIDQPLADEWRRRPIGLHL